MANPYPAASNHVVRNGQHNGLAAGSSSYDQQPGRLRILNSIKALEEVKVVLRKYNYYHEEEKSGPSRGRKSVLKLSCVGCRDTKVKCMTETEGVGPCTRCVRRGEECIFEKHRRTQKRDAE